MRRKPRRRSNPLLIALLLGSIGYMLYFSQAVAPAMPMLLVPTYTPTRNPESFISEAEQYYRQGKLTQAIASYKDAIAADPYNASNYVTLARIQVFAGQYEEAITNTQNALLKNPNNPLAHAVNGWALGFTGDTLAAEAAIKRALELDPNNALAHAFYAEILVNTKNFENLNQAIEESRIARQLDPTLLEVRRARGLVLLNTGNENLDEAIAEFKAAIALNDKIADLHLNLGYAYKLKGDNDLAVEELLTAFALNPNNPNSLTEVSLAYANEGQFGKASQYAEQAMKVDPSNGKLHGNLGVMYYRNREMVKAANHLALAIQGGTTEDGSQVVGLPLDYGSVAQFYWFYGFALAKTLRCNEAIPIFQALLIGVPDYQLAVDNANAGLDLCLEFASTPLPPTPQETTSSEATATATASP